MARRRNRNGDDRRLRSESSRSESSQMESNTSDADSETDISISESFPVRFRKRHSGCSPISPIGRGQKQSSSPSSGSEADGGSRYRHKRQKRKSRPGNWMEEGTLVQELNDWRRKDSSSYDSNEGDTTTDPDIESGNTSSDSEDDGYAEGTKRQIALMGDRWARYDKQTINIILGSLLTSQLDSVESSKENCSCPLIQDGKILISLFGQQERANLLVFFAGAVN